MSDHAALTPEDEGDTLKAREWMQGKEANLEKRDVGKPEWPPRHRHKKGPAAEAAGP